MIEFFWTTEKTRLMVHDLQTDEVEAFTLSKLSLAKKVDRKVKECYPETWEKLCDIYGDADAMVFARANRFLKCNFSVHDNRPDIDDDFNFDLELVPCPLRGECKDNICKPKLTSSLTDRELDVIRLHVEGLSQDEIGDRLYISGRTAHNHISNIYRKLNLCGTSCPDKGLINYAYKHGLL